MKYIYFRLLGIFLLFSFGNTCFAENVLTIINHFDQPLHFAFTKNRELLPDFPNEFSVAPSDNIVSRVIDGQPHAYIRVYGNDTEHYAFWGVESVNNKVIFHGYLGKGIAYSWTEQVLTFCTPIEYRQHGKCL